MRSSTKTKQRTDTHLVRAREQGRRSVKWLTTPAVAVTRYSWCRAVGSCVQRLCACVLLGCLVLCACWPCGCRCGCKTTDDTSRRTRVIPVVDRANNSPFLFLRLVLLPSSTENMQQTGKRLVRAREQGRRSVKGLIQLSRTFVIHSAAL